MNAAVQVAPRSHRAPRRRLVRVPAVRGALVSRTTGVLGAALCCTAAVMVCAYVLSTKVA